MGETWNLIGKERLRFADALEALRPEQWTAASQCSEWTVRDAVAHVAMTPFLRPPRVLPAMLRHRFNVPKLLSALAREDQRSPSELIASLRAIAEDRHTPPRAKAANVLADLVLHQQDVFRPVGVTYAAQPDAQVAAAELLTTSDFNCGSATRSRDVRLVADDIPWMHGEGAEARGPLHALLEAIGGRRAAIADLSGPGAEVLADRCPPVHGNPATVAA